MTRAGLTNGRGDVVEPQIRKIVSFAEEVLVEGGLEVPRALRVCAAAAVVENPYAGAYVEDLKPLQQAYCVSIGSRLAEELVRLLGGERAEAFGKGAIVGLEGEVEHASAILHNLDFGDPIRSALAATSLLPSAEKRAAAGATLDIPLKHITDVTVRSHHATFEIRVPDAPRPTEILVALSCSTGGRPHARIGTFGEEREGAEVSA